MNYLVSPAQKMKALLAGEDDAIEEAAANLAEIFAGMGNEVRIKKESTCRELAFSRLLRAG